MKKGILIVVGILILGLISFAVYRTLTFDETPTFEQKEVISVTPEETADWKTYQNQEYGFEVRYPKESFVDGCDEDGFCYTGLEDWVAAENTYDNSLTEFNYVYFGPKSFRLDGYLWSIYLVDKNELEELIRKIKKPSEQSAESDITQQSILINGNPAVLFLIKTKRDDGFVFRKFLHITNGIYTLAFTSQAENDLDSFSDFDLFYNSLVFN